MIGVWLLVGSLAGGVEGTRQESEFDSTSASAILSICVRAEISGRVLWDTDPARATIHFRRAMRGFVRLWQLGDHNSAVAVRLAECHFRFKEYPEAIAWSRRGLRFDPFDERCRSWLKRSRAEVRYPLDGEAASLLGPPAALTTPFQLNSLFVFGLYSLGWLMLARGWMKRRRLWLGLGLVAVVLSVGVHTWVGVEHRREALEWSMPTVVIRGPETMLRSGNGTLYPPRVNLALPVGMEARLLLRRGEWVQVELRSGQVGWVREVDGLVVGEAE